MQSRRATAPFEHPPAFEPLEPRLLLAGQVLLSEIMAANDATLADEDGDYPDWIELHNPTDEAVDLTGWKLRDEQAEWTFPSVGIGPGEFLVVFASDKDRADPAGELHTNFKLSADGEPLALLDATGQTVDAYPSGFPRQLEDISYGVVMNYHGRVVLADRGEEAKYLVPTDGSLGLSWTGEGFVDDAWSAGATGLGFGLGVPGGTLELVAKGAVWKYLDDGSDQGTGWREAGFDDTAWASGPAQLGYGDGDEATVVGFGGDSANKHITTYFRHTFTAAHAWQIAELSLELLRDDGAVVYLNGQEIARSNLPSGPIAQDTLASDGTGGAAESEWHGFTADAEGLLVDGDNVLAVEIHQRAPTSSDISFDLELTATSDAPDVLHTDVGGEMLGANASLYVRVPFLVDEPDELTGLWLDVTYEDGFIAYVNGVEVARRNAPTAAQWDAAATGDRPLADAVESVSIDISEHVGLLHVGANVLAVHAMNDAAGEGSFLIGPRLEAVQYIDAQENYLTTPTPGAANVPGVLGKVDRVGVDVQRGFYDAPVTVALACADAEAEVRYTLDGSTPTATTGAVYAGPITLNESGVLRGAAFRPGYLPSDVETHTYLIGESDAVRSLPVICLSAGEADVFGLDGLWADMHLRGRAAEFDVSFELFNSADETVLQQDAGIRLHCGSWRRTTWGADLSKKWSFKIFFRDEYDDPGTLDYDLIPVTDLDEYKRLVLRGGYNDPSNPFLKDELGRRLHADMGGPAVLGSYANVFINGTLYKNGYFNPTERTDDRTLQAMHHSDLPWDVVTNWGSYDPPREHPAPYSFDVRDGDHVSFAELLDYALGNDLSQPQHYQEVCRRLDVAEFIDYLLIQGYSAIRDWPHNNWNAARERSDGELGKWRFYAWDLELGWSSGELTGAFKTPGSSTSSPIDILYTALRASDEFRMLFADRAHAAFYNGGALTPENVVRRFEEMRAELADVLPNMNGYIRDTFAPQRPAYVLSSLRDKGLFTFAGPVLSLNDQVLHGGEVQPGDTLGLALAEGTAGTVYYTLDGTDPRLPGGGLSPNAVAYAGAVPLSGSCVVTARTLDGGVWSGLTEAGFYRDVSASLRLTETMYNPAPPTAEEAAAGFTDNDDFEFIELRNVGPEAIRLGGVAFLDGVEMTCPMVELPPGGYAVLVADAEAFAMRYDPQAHGITVLGEYRLALGNDGERIVLAGPLGGVIHDFQLDDALDLADGGGYSLTVVDDTAPLDAWTRADGWKPSERAGGTPGAGDTGPACGAVVISETLAHSDDPPGDWVELFNTTDGDIDIGGWFFSDNRAELSRYVIPAGTTVPAGGYVVLTEDDHFGGAFALSELGDDLYLTSSVDGAPGGYREHVDFGASAGGQTFGLHSVASGGTDFTLLAAATPGEANAAPFVGPLVVSEVMYHPAPPEAPGAYAESDYEFIELYNRSAGELDLAEFVLSGGVGFTFGWVDADAGGEARWTLQAGATARWQTALPEAGPWDVYARWRADDGEGGLRLLDSAAQWEIVHAGGSDVVEIDQNDFSEQWVPLGTYTFAAGPAAVTLARGTDDPDEWTLADEIRFLRGPAEIVVDAGDSGFASSPAAPAPLGAGQRVVLVRNAAAFADRYGPPAGGIIVAGQYSGKLANGGESVRVLQATCPQPGGMIPYVRVDHVRYGDEAPWPVEADGLGASLSRISADAYGSDVGNWGVGLDGGTPGQENAFVDSTPPSAPTDLHATVSVDALAIELTWASAWDLQSAVDHYVVYRDGAPAATAHTCAYSDLAAVPGQTYAYRVAAVNRDGYEGELSGTVEAGIVGIVSAAAPDGDTVRVEFTQALDAVSAQQPEHWDVPGAAVLSAELIDGGWVVLLTVEGLVETAPYTVTVRNVKTASGAPVPAGLAASFHYVRRGAPVLLLEYWTDVSGNAVSNLTGSAGYPKAPDGRAWPGLFEVPAAELGLGDNYGTRMRGYLYPPQTGEYTFWIASDNDGQLLLSTDDDPAHVRQVAYVSGWTRSREWTKFPSQCSEPIYLEAGRRYYVETLHKEGGGGDSLAVRWQLPDGTIEEPVGPARLSPYALGPHVTGWERNDGADAPGALSSVAVRFSGDVRATLEAGDLALWDRSLGSALDLGAAVCTYDEQTDTARWDLQALAVPPGHYTLTLAADKVADAAGVALDGDGDDVPGGDFTVELTVAQPGDATLDGAVDFRDYLGVKWSLGLSSGATWAAGNFDGDEDVDGDDLSLLEANFNGLLAGPVPPANGVGAEEGSEAASGEKAVSQPRAAAVADPLASAAEPPPADVVEASRGAVRAGGAVCVCPVGTVLSLPPVVWRGPAHVGLGLIDRACLAAQVADFLVERDDAEVHRFHGPADPLDGVLEEGDLFFELDDSRFHSGPFPADGWKRF